MASNGNTSSAVANSAARLRYFLGQRLTQRDLQAEQRYHVLLRRLMQRELFGTGTVAGLEITRPATSPERDRSVIVNAGLAMDPDGRELLVERDVVLDIAPVPVVAGTAPFPPSSTPDSATVLATDVRTRYSLEATDFVAGDVNELIARLTAAGLMVAADPAPVTTLRGHIARITATPPDPLTTSFQDWLFGQLVGSFHVGLTYRENGTDPAPTIVDASCCAGVTCFPTRTQEGVVIALSAAAFPAIADPHAAFLACLGNLSGGTLTCEELRVKLATCIFGMWRDLASVEDPCGEGVFPVVPLGLVNFSVIERAGGQILTIDNTGERLLALGVPMLRAFGDALAGCTGGP